MRKLLVLAMVLMLSLSLVWAAETVKNTNPTKALRSQNLEKAAIKEKAAAPVEATKVRPAKPADESQTLDPNALNEPVDIPEIQSAKKSQGLATEIKSVDVPAGYVGEGINKEAAMLEALQQEAQIGKWEPQYGAKGEILNPEPTIDGNTYIPDYGGSTPITASVLMSQTFHQTGWDIDTPPVGWTAADSGTEGSLTWYVDDWHKFYYVATGWNDTAFASSWSTAAYSESLMSEWLITPAFDLSAATNCSLYLKEYYDNIGVRDSANIMVSIDNGVNWARVRTFKADSTTTRNRWVNLTSYVGPTNSQVKVGFWHFSAQPATGSNGWVVDSITVKVDGTNLWVQDFSNVMAGWFGNNTLTGPGGIWTILDNGIVTAPKAKNANDWNRRVGNLGTDTVAACTYTSSANRREFENEWLISPQFSITGTVACTLSLNEYWNFDGAATFFPPGGTTVNEHGYIKIQETTDGGTSWGPWQIIADHNNVGIGSSNTLPVYRGKYPLNTWRGKTVRLGFQKLAPPEASFATWYMSHLQVDDYTMYNDDVASVAVLAPTYAHSAGSWPVKSRVANVGENTETFEDSTVISTMVVGSTMMSTGFENAGLIPTGWTDSPGGASAWKYDAGVSHGPGTVHGGSYAAYYDAYNYVAGTTDSLISPVMDLSTPGGLYGLDFWFWHSSGTDSLRVYLDDAGVKTYLMTVPNAAAWTKYSISFNSTSTTVKVYFVGYSRYGSYNLYLDDVSVYSASIVRVYAGGTTVSSLAPFTLADATMNANWIAPSVGNYSIRTFTALAGDGNSANDAATGSNITVLAHTSTGGPDAGFYSFKDNWAVGGPVFSWVDMSAAIPDTFSGTIDSGWRRIAMPSPFFYYGSMKDRVWLSTDGFVTFDSIASGYLSNYALPSTNLPNNQIAFMWDDLQASNLYTGAKHLDDGTRFVIQYDNIEFYSTPNTDTFDVQIILNRADSTITVQYRGLGTAMQTDATIGIENSTGTIGLPYFSETNLGNYPIEGMAIKYNYTAPAANVGIASFDGPNGALDAATPYTMSATAQNYTANAAVFNVEFYADAALIGTVVGVSLPGSGSQSVSCPATWTPTTTGLHSLQAKTVYVGDTDISNDQITVSRIALGSPVTLPFTTDFEANNGGLTGTNEWEWGIPTYVSGPTAAHSPVNLWGTDLDNQYDPTILSTLYLPPVDMTSAVAPNLTFWMWHYSESTYDGANVKVSIDGGNTWTLVTTSVAYNGALSMDNINMGGQQAWSGSRPWTEVRLNLVPYLGSTLLIKIDFAGDPSFQYAGFYVDDVSIAEPPSDDIGVTAILAPGALTIQGFSWTVAARVHNFGLGTQTNVPVHFEIRDIANSLVYDQTYTLSTIGSNVDSTVIFPSWSAAESDTHKVVSYTVLPADILNANDTTKLTTYTYPHIGTGSGSRWTYADNVTGGGPDFGWIDIKTLGTQLTFADLDDGNSGMQEMGFNFAFLGGTYHRINVNVNGYLSFTDSTTVGSSSYNNVAIPTATAPNGIVAANWDDMYMRPNAKVFQYYDAVENQFIVQYDSVEYYSPAGSDLGFEVIFDGDDNSIKMQYLYAALGSQTDVTVGLENATGLEGLAYNNNGQVGQTPFAGMAITWTYAPPQVDVAFEYIIGQVGIPGSLPVCAHFANSGADAGTVTAHFEVRDGSNVLVFSGNGSGTVPAGGSATICAASNWTATTGAYTINVTATVPDDGNPANNGGTGSIQINTGMATYPVLEDFESAVTVFPPAGWTILHYGASPAPNGTWQESILHSRSPVTSAFQDDDPNAVKDEWLVMQPVDLTSAYQPSWKYYEVGNFFADWGIAHEFYVGTGPVFDINTATMVGQHLPGVHDIPTPTADPDQGFEVGDNFDLASYVGQSVVWCAFRYQGEYSDEWWIDDVAIRGPIQYDATVLSIDSPAGNTATTDANDVLVTVTNLGYGSYTFDVNVVITGATSGEVYNHTVAATNVGQNVPYQVTFPDFTPTCLEQYTITVTTLGVGDEDAGNNSMSSFFDIFAFGMKFYTDGTTGYIFPHAYGIDANAARMRVPAGNTATLNSGLFYFYSFGDVGEEGDITPMLWGSDVDGVIDPLTILWTGTPIHIGPTAGYYPVSFDLSTSGVAPTADFYIGYTTTAGTPGLVGEGAASAMNYPANQVLRLSGSWYYTTDVWTGPRDMYLGCDYSLVTSFVDAAPTTVVSPGGTMIGVGPFDVIVNVANAGLTDIADASATATITGPGGVDFTATVNDIDLLAGAASPIDFGNWAPSAGFETYTVDVSVTAAGDQNTCNDAISSTSYILLGTVQSDEDFEATNGGFTEVVVSGDPVWQWGIDTGVSPVPSGDHVWGTILNGNYPVGACASLRSPAMTVSTNGGAIAFYTWYMLETEWDYCNVKISTDGGTTFSVLTPVGGYDSQEINGPDNLCDLLDGQNGFSEAKDFWQIKAFDLTGYEGLSVIFSIDFSSDLYVVDYGFYLDNFMLIEYPQSGCVYTPGDINGVGGANGIDVSFGVNYFKGGALPAVICDMCPQTQPFFAAGDVNASCTFNGIDITYFVGFLKGGPALQFCATCPPAGAIAAPAVIAPIGKTKVTEVGSDK